MMAFTENELKIIREAVDMRNDIMNDTLFEDLPVDLFPRPGETVTFDYDQAVKLRDELFALINEQVEYRNLLNKLGIKINPKTGYSV